MTMLLLALAQPSWLRRLHDAASPPERTFFFRTPARAISFIILRPHFRCRAAAEKKTMVNALVLGATGGIGGEVARRLVARGWSVRALHRDPEKLPPAAKANGLSWRQGDAMSASDVAAAATGVDVIVHAVNPPGYKNWGKLVLPMIDNTIAAATAVNARIVLPGTVYNFGPDSVPHLDENSPQNP